MALKRLSTVGFALVSATLLIAHQVAAKATRDAVFLSQYEVVHLPKLVMAAAIVSMLAVLLMARLLAQHGPHKAVPPAFALSAVLFFIHWWAFPHYTPYVAIALYLHVAVFGVVLISGFWSVVNERFDPHAAKQTVARIAAAATLGGVLGGAITGTIADTINLRAMLLVLAVLHIACFVSVRAMTDSDWSTSTAQNAGLATGLKLLVSHRYLQLMAVLLVLVAMIAALGDYVLKSQASTAFHGEEALAIFFGRFYALVGLITFLIQFLLGPRVLKRFGIGLTLGVMPALVFSAGLLAAAVTQLWSIVMLRGTQMTFANSFFRSAFELLYTPLSPLTKRPTKALIDVAADRLGDVLGSGILLLLLAFAPALPLPSVVILIVILAMAALVVVRRIFSGYVQQLASSLRDGAISLQDEQVIDATTRHTLAEISAARERKMLLEKIRKRKYERAGTTIPGQVPLTAAASLAPDESAREMGDCLIELLSGDPERIRTALASAGMDLRLAPYLIPLLGNDVLAEEVRMELRWRAPQIIGLLADALVDPDLPLIARQRIPSVLEVTHSPRVVRTLMTGLHEEQFNIRFSCARALARMQARDPYMRVNQAAIMAIVEHEVVVDNDTWRARDLQFDIDLPLDLAAGASADKSYIDYSLEHVFTLLSLTLDREALQLAAQAVLSDDRKQRGTALEYLENVLPESVRDGLWRHLGETSRGDKQAARSSTDLLESLRRTARSAS